MVPESVVGSPPKVRWIFALPSNRPVKTALLLSAAGRRSTLLTPPSTFTSDQVAGVLVTKLP